MNEGKRGAQKKRWGGGRTFDADAKVTVFVIAGFCRGARIISFEQTGCGRVEVRLFLPSDMTLPAESETSEN